MTTPYRKPLPGMYNSALTRPFWEAVKRHELMLQRCKTCGRWIWFPREMCPYCMSQDLEWARASGKGRLYSFTIVYQPASAAFRDDVPYANITVLLDEGVRMNSGLVGHSPIPEVLTQYTVPDDIKVDMPVEAVFDDVTPEWTLVKFRPVRET